jgi:hypothetical protein
LFRILATVSPDCGDFHPRLRTTSPERTNHQPLPADLCPLTSDLCPFAPPPSLSTSSSSPVVFLQRLRDGIKTTSPASRPIPPLCNAFLAKAFSPLPTWVCLSNTATLMKNLPPVTTNEKFVQYYCWTTVLPTPL